MKNAHTSYTFNLVSKKKKRRYQISCARRMSEITFIRYDQSQYM